MFAKNLQKRETSCRKLVQDFRQSMVTTAIILKSRNSFSEVLYWLLKTLSTVTIFQWKAIENQRKLLKIWTTLRQTKLSEKRCWRLNLRCQKLFSIVTKNTTTVVKNESVLNFSKLSGNAVAMDKNRLTVDQTHHKPFEALSEWYLSEHIRERTHFKLRAPVWCQPKTLGLENQ